MNVFSEPKAMHSGVDLKDVCDVDLDFAQNEVS